MEFIYDSVFGLTYTNLGSFYTIDIAKIPEEFNTEQFLDLLQLYNNKGIIFSDAVEEVCIPIYSNY